MSNSDVGSNTDNILLPQGPAVEPRTECMALTESALVKDDATVLMSFTRGRGSPHIPNSSQEGIFLDTVSQVRSTGTGTPGNMT